MCCFVPNRYTEYNHNDIVCRIAAMLEFNSIGTKPPQKCGGFVNSRLKTVLILSQNRRKIKSCLVFGLGVLSIVR